MELKPIRLFINAANIALQIHYGKIKIVRFLSDIARPFTINGNIIEDSELYNSMPVINVGDVLTYYIFYYILLNYFKYNRIFTHNE